MSNIVVKGKQVFQSKSKTKLQEKVNFSLFSFSIKKDIIKGKKTQIIPKSKLKFG